MGETGRWITGLTCPGQGVTSCSGRGRWGEGLGPSMEALSRLSLQVRIHKHFPAEWVNQEEGFLSSRPQGGVWADCQSRWGKEDQSRIQKSVALPCEASSVASLGLCFLI